VFEEPTSESFLQDHNMSKMLGTMNQLAYLSSFALEIFQNLAILSEDLSERIKLSSVRTTALFDNLRAVDREVSSIDDDSHIAPITGLSAYLQSREMFTPQLFNKATNYSSIATQYRICRPPPQLWRIEVFTHEDCFRNYSNPGFFFQEWIRTEIVRQQIKKEEKRKTKALRKLQRQERKKQKEAAAEEELYMEERPSTHTNVSLSGVTDKHKRNKSILSPSRDRSEKKDQTVSVRVSPPKDRDTQQQQQREREHSSEILLQESFSDAEQAGASVRNKEKEKEKKKGLKGLSKLFGRSKKDKQALPGSAESEEESVEEEDAPLQLSKAESLSLQILSGGERDRERDRLSDSDDAAVPRNHHSTASPPQPPAPVRPKSYVDELTAATVSSRRMSIIRDQGALSRHFGSSAGDANGAHNAHTHLAATRESAYEDDEAAEENEAEHIPIQLNLKAAKKNKKAAVTMKIGSKFLSASAGGTGKTEKTVTAAAPEPSSMHRRGSARLSQIPEEGAARGRLGSEDIETGGHRLIRPTSSPPTATTHKRASFSMNLSRSNADGDSRLLTNKRQSFTLPASMTAGIFDRTKSWAVVEEEAAEESEMHGSSNLRRRSLLTMLQEEVFEELYAGDVEDAPEDDGEFEEEDFADGTERTGSPGKSLDMTEDDVDPDEENEEEDIDEEIIDEEDVEDGDVDEDLIEEEDRPVSEGDLSEGPGPDEEDEPSSPGGPEDSVGPSDGGTSPPDSPKERRRSVTNRPPPPRAGGPPPPPPPGGNRPGPPPPPPAPMRSALNPSVLGSLKAGGRDSLKKVAPPPEPKVDDRAHLLRSIQLGSAQLNKAPAKPAAPFQKIAVQVTVLCI